MCGDAEFGRCDCCGKDAVLNRKYFHYDIKCNCCGGNKHFELVRYCEKCTPRAPSRVRIVLENLKPIDDKPKLKEGIIEIEGCGIFNENNKPKSILEKIFRFLQFWKYNYIN